MSEMRRTARALVETRSERFESRHPLAASKARLEESLARARPTGRSAFGQAWSEHEGRAILDATFAPPTSTARLLKGFSIGMAVALGASAWAVATQEGTVAFLVPLLTVLATLAVPFVALGLGSQREAEEARIARAIRVALLDEEERLPPRQRWSDEDPG